MNVLLRWQSRFFTTWPVAAAALGGMLILIATSVWTTSQKAEAIYEQLDRLNAHHRDVEGKLRRLRGDVHLSSIYIRDYLLDTAKERAPEYRQHLTELRRNHTTTLAELRALTTPNEAARIDQLEAKLDEYWTTFEPLFDWTIVEKIMYSARFLRGEVLPRREEVLAITQGIEELNNANLAVQRAGVARRLADFREDLLRRLIRSLSVGFLIALVAVLRLRALERRSNQQRQHAERAEQEMRLLSQQLVAAQEEERKKLTRELHDHIGQMLTALRMEIGRAERSRSASDTHARNALRESKHLLDTILRSVRDLAMGLRPSMLDDFGLQPALEWHVRDFRRRFNIPVDLALHGEVNALPDHYRTCIYRVVQEALTNCARHARPAHVGITLRLDRETLELIVVDDGIGIDPTRARGVGLVGIEERVRELHGEFSVTRRDEGGTRLHVTIPVNIESSEGELARATG